MNLPIGELRQQPCRNSGVVLFLECALSEREVNESSAKPARQAFRIKAATDMVTRIGDAILLLDLTINDWSEQLNRAQPHRNGRLVVRFGKNSYVRFEGSRIYEVEPIVGKMVQMQSGSWSFFKLTDRDQYEKLSDLRVGKTLKSDPLVVRLIDGIEDLLKQREALCEALVALRGMQGKVDAAMATCVRRGGQVYELAERVKIDWMKGADRAEQLIIEQRRDRYKRLKAKQSSESPEVTA